MHDLGYPMNAGGHELRGLWTWPGGSVWLGRASAVNEAHRHYAMQLSIVVDGSARMAVGGGPWQDFDVALFDSMVCHAFDPSARYLAQVMVEPISGWGLGLRSLLGGQPALRIGEPDAGVLKSIVAGLRGASGDRDECIGAAFRILEQLTSCARPAAAPEPRVAAMCDHIRDHIGDVRITLAQVAGAAGLSPERARHLFREQTGMAVRPYVLWTRLNSALELLAVRERLTSVAHDCGFADSAHFTRTFRKVYGITPSLLLKSSQPIALDAEAARNG